MGSIVSIYRKPERLIIDNQERILKATGEKVKKVTYGEIDDYGGSDYFWMWIRESILEKLNSGEYHIGSMIECGRNFVIYDKDNNAVEPIKKDYIY